MPGRRRLEALASRASFWFKRSRRVRLQASGGEKEAFKAIPFKECPVLQVAVV